MLKRLILAAGAAAIAAGLTVGPSLAQDYPERPVEFIVPWAPGGGSDVLMRLIANHIEPYLGQPVPVINVPGVSGTVGLQEASRRDADGYTVTQIHEGLPVAHYTGITELNWDDFEPIALMTASPQYLVVNADSPWQTFEEFVEYARESPGDIRIGVTLGGVPHLHAAMIEESAEIEFSYVGYEGTGERIRALVGGNLDAAIGDVASAGQFVENGDLRFLATGAPERVDEAPDVPTFQELGHDLELQVTRGIVAPMGTPQEALDAWEEALRQLSEDDEYLERTNNAGAAVDFRGQEDFRTYLENLDATIQRLSSKLEG
jgi:tripartite-type tricarboxylate transporter receptor subunit TctC